MPLLINSNAKTRLRNPNLSLAEPSQTRTPLTKRIALARFFALACPKICGPENLPTDAPHFPAVFLDSKHGETKSAD